MLQIPGELEKGNADRRLPIAPEFALFLWETPEVSKIVSKSGKAAGVKVYVNPKDPEKVKYASAHDFRRAFGVRWAARPIPAQLMELMRHESIETTLRFYVGTDAQRTAEAAWVTFEAVQRVFA
jgi:integrase